MSIPPEKPDALPIWTVAQIGARESYAAARVFAASGRLNRLYTDVWCRFGANWLRRGNAKMRSLAERRHADVPSDRVTAFTLASVWNSLSNRTADSQDSAATYEEFLRIGRWFDQRVCHHLERQRFSGRNAFFAYNTGCLETLGRLGDRGVKTIVDQIDPGRTEYELVVEEAARWPGWAKVELKISPDYCDRLVAEWEAAHAVVVNSEWSKTALLSQGIPDNKIHVVPLAYEPHETPQERRPTPKERPLQVLWLGSVILRKGIQYLMEAARLLSDRSIQFSVVGSVDISSQAIASAPANVLFKGRVTRNHTAEHYRNADLFVFPTLSDGFGLVQLEAMAHGLPVISTPNCGAVVEHGKNGLIVPARDPAALADAIASLDDDRSKLEAMSRQAMTTSQNYSLAAFGVRLDSVAGRLFEDS